MAYRVELAFRRSASECIPDGARVVAAVSGGGDSVALLHLLLRIAKRRGIEVSVAHLDHGLRRGSRADRTFVERLARQHGLRCTSDRRAVGPLRRKDESPEEAARRVRRAFLIEAAGATAADLVATGHTLDDQAETILMRLVRGAGATALTGMQAQGPGPFVRPLLGIERDWLRDYISRRGLEFREDPSNRSLRFDRNRVRHLVLPFLEQTLNPRAARHLVKAAERFREDACYLDEVAERAFRRLARRENGKILVDGSGLMRAPAAVSSRVARLALRQAGVDARRVATRHLQALIDLAQGPAGRSIHLPNRLVARSGRTGIEIEHEPQP